MQLVVAGEPTSFELFTLVAILYSLAAVPVALAPASAPAPPRTVKLRLGWLMSVSPAAVLGCFGTGLANASFWTLEPALRHRRRNARARCRAVPDGRGLGRRHQPVAGRAPVDRVGRRPMAMIVCAVAALAGLGLYAASTESQSIILPLGALYGAAAFTVYTLCVAHANDLVHKKRAVEVSSGLLLVFSMGAVIGPLIASFMMRELGHGALFLYSAMAHLGIALVMILRVQQRPKLPIERNEPFVSVPKTTPAVFDLDPRGEGQGHAEAEDDARSEPAEAGARHQGLPAPPLLPTRSNA